MFTRIENNKGIISYDASLMDQLINDALSPFAGNYKLIKKEYAMVQEGTDVFIECHLKFGTSISAFSDYVLKNLYDMIDNHLELTVHKISILISAVYSKKSVPRNIRIEINNKSEISHN